MSRHVCQEVWNAGKSESVQGGGGYVLKQKNGKLLYKIIERLRRCQEEHARTGEGVMREQAHWVFLAVLRCLVVRIR